MEATDSKTMELSDDFLDWMLATATKGMLSGRMHYKLHVDEHTPNTHIVLSIVEAFGNQDELHDLLSEPGDHFAWVDEILGHTLEADTASRETHTPIDYDLIRKCVGVDRVNTVEFFKALYDKALRPADKYYKALLAIGPPFSDEAKIEELLSPLDKDLYNQLELQAFHDGNFEMIELLYKFR